MRQIITSILDNDLYKFTMMNTILKTYPDKKVEYTFYNRDKREFPAKMGLSLWKQVAMMSEVKLTQVEELFIRKEFSHLFDEEFFCYLRDFRFDPKQVFIDQQGTDLTVRVVGTWVETILWEVILMAMISELYFIKTQPLTKLSDFKTRTYEKGLAINKGEYPVIEMGTRRRFSKLAQSLAIGILKMTCAKYLVGTSNVYFGMIHNVPVKGTVAHEWIMFHGAEFGYEEANKKAMLAWQSVYGVNLDTLLTDTYTTDVFLRTFTQEDGVYAGCLRQDSGCPKAYTDKILHHYKQIGIPARTKTIMYSDGLNLDKVAEIALYRKGEIKKAYGMGTFITNDIEGVKPLNMVIKLSSVEKKLTVKLSDDIGKNTGHEETILKCKKELGL